MEHKTIQAVLEYGECWRLSLRLSAKAVVKVSYLQEDSKEMRRCNLILICYNILQENPRYFQGMPLKYLCN